ncbi:MAG: DUF2304 domain-containing protein [Parasporobacterium sp.]|nr:DUF2304 domain-containing protein [Parasporobacterium sp.]
MTLRLQIIVIVVAVLAILFTVLLIKKDRLGLRIAMPWLVVFVLIILFAAIPSLMDWFSGLIGIYAPVNMVLFLAGIFLMIIIYSLTITVFTNRKKVRDLIQKVAYLEEKIKKEESSETDDR